MSGVAPTRAFEAEPELRPFPCLAEGCRDSCSPLKAVYVQLNPHTAALSFPLFFSKTASGGGGVSRRMTEGATRSRTPAMDTANPNIHTIVKAQIVFLLSTLTEENFDRNQVEIRSVSVPA